MFNRVNLGTHCLHTVFPARLFLAKGPVQSSIASLQINLKNTPVVDECEVKHGDAKTI